MKYLLLPFALLYGLVATIRNKLFDCGILKSKSYQIPIITVGNLTVGGTGKTPHIEYLVRLLRDEHKTAVVSRGYGRKTSGYIEVETNSNAEDVGDEPLQLKRKFQNIRVIVDEVRTHAIDTLLNEKCAPDIFLLDDAFQHRSVKAGLQLALVDYNRPIFNDFMMPMGRLREPRHNINRADIVIVTKCPDNLNENSRIAFANKLKLINNQPIFFTKISYGNLMPINSIQTIDNLNNTKILVVSGIAQPERIYQYLHSKKVVFEKIEFADHHFFNNTDIESIRKKFKDSASQIIVTTEKDAMRLINGNLINKLQDIPIYSLPIEIEFADGRQEEFKMLIERFANQCN